MNILTGTARLARDAEVRHTNSGTTVCSFSAAMDSGFGDNKKPVWLRMALFGKRAEGKLPQYLLKGAQIAFSGELQVREYDDNDGNKRTSVEVNINSLDLIGGQQQNGQSSGNNGGFPSQGGNQQRQQNQGNQNGGQNNNAPNFDDIPF